MSAFFSLMGRFSFRLFAVLASYCLWNFRALFLNLAFTSGAYTSDWSRNRRTMSVVIVLQVE